MHRLERWSALLGLLLFAQTADLGAQTKVRRYDVTKETDYGIVYSLPHTEVEAVVRVRELIYTPGVLSSYADRYLNKKVADKPSHTYELVAAQLYTVGRADTTQQYLVSFDRKTLAPFVKLTDTGILFSINGGGELPKSLTEERHSRIISERQPDKAHPALPREYAQAGSKAKQAEIASTYLYDLRESLMNLVSGSVENMPKDGESMRLALEQLRREEYRTQRLFLGDTTERISEYILRYTPTKDTEGEITLARFSSVAGLTQADDLSGIPLRLKLVVTERAPELNEKEQRKKDKMLEHSIVYVQPGLARISLVYEGKTLADEQFAVAQLGTLQALAPKMLQLTPNATTAVYFDIRTGAVLDIRQE